MNTRSSLKLALICLTVGGLCSSFALMTSIARADTPAVENPPAEASALVPAPVIPQLPQLGSSRDKSLRVFCWAPTLMANQVALAADAADARQISFTFHGRSQTGAEARNVFAVGYQLSPSAYSRAAETGRLGSATVMVKTAHKQFRYKGNPSVCSFG